MAGERQNKTGDQKRKKIILSGGGTGGSVTPLLAVAQELLKDGDNVDIVFVGSQTGPELEMVRHFNSEVGVIRFVPLVAGKWRRYIAWQNISDIFRIGAAFFKSLALLKKEAPDLVISAGSFVSVPLVWAAALKRIPILIHQQDARPGLANKLMAPFARVITVNFEKSLLDYGPRTILIGNPLMATKLDSLEAVRKRVLEKYQWDGRRPLILLTGGRMGAKSLNSLLWSARQSLLDFQIINLSGPGKSPLKSGEIAPDNYQILEYLPHEEILELIRVADLVITRAGLGMLTELALFNKPAIIIPMPHTHQEDNSDVFARAEAAIVLDQDKLSPKILTSMINKVLVEPGQRQKLANNIGHVIKRGAAARLAGIIWEILATK